MPTKTKRRVPRTLTDTLYIYAQKVNGKFVRTEYKAKGHDSYSEFIDALITKERTKRAPKTKAA